MSDAISTPQIPLKWLALGFEALRVHSNRGPVAKTPGSNDLEDVKTETMKRLENGYIAEDTGCYVTVPDFVARQIKARLDVDDQC